MNVARRALVTGATGFVGGRLAGALGDRDWKVRCLVRDRSRARELADRIPAATSTRLRGGDHYITEERPDEVTAALLELLGSRTSLPSR